MDDFNRRIAHICSRCGGKCCSWPLVSAEDADRLRRAANADCLVKRGPFFHIRSSPWCAFLSEEGCVLPAEARPVDCRYFPMCFAREKGGEIRVKMHSRLKCPFARLIAADAIWREAASAYLEEAITKWSDDEVAWYGRHHRRSRLAVNAAKLIAVRATKGILNLIIHGRCDTIRNPFRPCRNSPAFEKHEIPNS